MRSERLLVVAPTVPQPDRHAGHARFYEMLRILSRHMTITFVPLRPPGADEVWMKGYADALRRLDVDVRLGDMRLRDLLGDESLAAILFETWGAASWYLDAARCWRPDVAILVDSVDLHYVRELRMAAVEPSLRTVPEALATKRGELAVYRLADLVIAVTDHDRRLLLDELPMLDVVVVSSIHRMDRGATGGGERVRGSLLFVGGFEHRPNVDAILFFCREVFPRIRRADPGVSLTVVGSAPPPEVTQLGAEEGVTVVGYVEDLEPYLRRAWVSIAPLRYGSGIKGKISEAMCAGVPVVTTSIGAEGMDLVPGETAMIADTPDGFARATLQLCADPMLHGRMSEAIRATARTRYSPEAAEASLMEALSTCRTRRSRYMTLGVRAGCCGRVIRRKVRRWSRS